jgi:hypothetical protein
MASCTYSPCRPTVLNLLFFFFKADPIKIQTGFIPWVQAVQSRLGRAIEPSNKIPWGTELGVIDRIGADFKVTAFKGPVLGKNKENNGSGRPGSGAQYNNIGGGNGGGNGGGANYYASGKGSGGGGVGGGGINAGRNNALQELKNLKVQVLHPYSKVSCFSVML